MTASPAPATVDPDRKDWTWVLRRPCPDCGFDASAVSGPQVSATLRDAAERWATVLARSGMTQRPASQVWSPLEYQCHVRDVCRLFDMRLGSILEQDDPTFADWDQDQAAVRERYDTQDPALSADELADAAAALAARFDRVRDEQWQRSGRRSDGAVFTAETLGQYVLHDVVHHLHDVGA